MGETGKDRKRWEDSGRHQERLGKVEIDGMIREKLMKAEREGARRRETKINVERREESQRDENRR